MLKNFNISKFKNNKPPSNNSIRTKNEIKELKKIPIRERFVKEMDDGEKNFTKVVFKLSDIPGISKPCLSHK